MHSFLKLICLCNFYFLFFCLNWIWNCSNETSKILEILVRRGYKTRDAFPQENVSVIAQQCKIRRVLVMTDGCVHWVSFIAQTRLHVFLWAKNSPLSKGEKWMKSKKKTSAGHSWFYIYVGWVFLRCQIWWPFDEVCRKTLTPKFRSCKRRKKYWQVNKRTSASFLYTSTLFGHKTQINASLGSH